MKRETRGMLLSVLVYGAGLGEAHAEDAGVGEELDGAPVVADEFISQQQAQESIADAILTLQPWFTRAKTDTQRRSRRQHVDHIVRAISSASKTHDIDPLLSVAIAFRESSLLPEVGLGARTGAHGDVGYFQVLPNSAAQRLCGTCEDLADPMCNAHVALCYMKRVRDHCGSDNPWVWVGGYGRSRCPRSLREARSWGEVRRARSLFCKVHRSCDQVWPA